MDNLNNTFTESDLNCDAELLETNLSDWSFGNISEIREIDLENMSFDNEVSLDEILNNNVSLEQRGEK